MVNKVLNYKFKSSYICKISWNIWTNAFFNWNLIEINFLQKAKNHNYDNLAIEALVYMKNVRHITYCRNPIIASLLLWYADSRVSALGTCWAPISVSVTRGFFSDDWDTAEDRMAFDVDELLTVVLVFEAGVDAALFFAATAASYNIQILPVLLTNKFKKIVLLIHLWTQKYVNDNERKSISDKSTAYPGFPFAFSLFPLFPGSLQSLIFLPFLPLSFPLCLFFPSLLFPFPLLCLLFPPLLFFPLLPLFFFSSFPFHFSCLPWWSHWLGFLWGYRPTITLLYSMFWSKSSVLCVSHYRLN